MKKKDVDELKTKNSEQLAKLVAELEKEKANLRLELAQGKLKNVHAMAKKKKDLAQTMTILRAKIFVERETKENAE
ncbi:50S ribosomal protein L29 [Candidatus Curtissbacteria bacterium]|nr:50S ribosomal protein L29 [Candidatus Curtissbacteria bacterium]